MATTRTRVTKLRRQLKQSGADALLVTNFKNVTYLTGFTGDDSYLLVTAKEEILFSDPRYSEQLEAECPHVKLEVREQGTSILDAVAKTVGKAKIGKLGIESESMTVQLFNKVVAKLPKVEVKQLDGFVEELRVVKDKGEIALTREAISLAEKAFAVLKAGLRGDQTEKELDALLTYEIQRNGGRGTSFPPIVGVGPRAARPHGTPGMVRMEEDSFVLIDWGADYRFYKSDLTRVLFYGKVPAKMRKMYETCLKAQLAAIDAIQPGVIMSDVDKAARSIIAKAGWGKQFGHGLGHGIGLDIHESPRLNSLSHRPLEAGMIVTVEPGIYFPGFGGVRIEDDVLVTKDGHEVLTSVPKSFEEATITL
ncbi:putative peptidase [Bremerella volcania]|uniref:Putative peptidase n=1 Tax=Bremerella volcania TaxID=2527984 RepID=A0A518C6N9_9BACT|nr:Xaa-Pro peptidase family protein [Bremerella volcania]QDU74872.1 putative peptidase [Bremerella volcania]